MITAFFILHLLSACLWVGGMFFAYVVLRPAASQLLDPPSRLKLWQASFKRFFVWVWAFVLLLPFTGYGLIFYKFGGMANVGISVHIMQLTGWLMVAIYLVVFFKPYKKLSQLISESNWSEASGQLNSIRKLIFTNLTLGLITIIIAASHRVFT